MNCLNLIYEHLQAVSLIFYMFFVVNNFVQEQNGQDSTVVLQLFSGDTVIYKLSQSKTDHLTGFKKRKIKIYGFLKFIIIMM